jgi:hypothetical protein
VCVLKEPVACDGDDEGAFGGDGRVAGAWAGTRSGCVRNASPPSHPFFQQADTPRCTAPHTSGEWLTERGHTFKPDDGCFFQPLLPEQLLPCMAGRWQVRSYICERSVDRVGSAASISVFLVASVTIRPC